MLSLLKKYWQVVGLRLGLRSRGLVATGLIGMGLIVGEARGDFPRLALEAVSVNELESPVGLTNAGDGSGRLFVVNQRGRIDVISNGSVLDTPFLDLSSRLVAERDGFDERGLLGLAFHPNFGQVGAVGADKFYVYYSAPSPNEPGIPENPVDHQSVISEFSATSLGSNVATLGSERILMTFDQPQFNHDGGELAFGPDGMLYIATGDGGSSNDNNAGHTGGGTSRPNGPTVLGNAQDRTNLLGSVLRINVDGNNGPGGAYGIPADNPFVGEGGGVKEEIWAYGLRNPWRFSFDDGTDANPGTGDLLLADVGQGKVEEVNLITKGGNFGWRIKEGTLDLDPEVINPNPGPLLDPIVQYTRASLDGDPDVEGLLQVGVAAVGGHVYRGEAIPELVGKYIFADWSEGFFPGSGTLLGLEGLHGEELVLSVLNLDGGNPVGFYINAIGEDENGELYVVGRSVLAANGLDEFGNGSGQVFRIVRGVIPEPGVGFGVLTVVGMIVSVGGRRSSHKA